MLDDLDPGGCRNRSGQRPLDLCPGRVTPGVGDPVPVENMQLRHRSDLAAALAEAADGAEIPGDLSEEHLADRRRIIDVLAACAGNQTVAAQKLSISRRWLITKMKRYNIPRPTKGAG